jgi:hypothetical protein
MANEIFVAGLLPGTAYYAQLRAPGAVYNTVSAQFEPADGAHAGNWPNYTLGSGGSGPAALLAEQFGAGQSGDYEGDMPAGIVRGAYTLVSYQRMGATPALSDPRVAAGPLSWTGAAESAPPPTDSTGAVLVALDLAQLLGIPPTSAHLTNDGDAAITLGDALWAAVVTAYGQQALVGNSYQIRTPAGTLTLTFTLDSPTMPNARSLTAVAVASNGHV